MQDGGRVQSGATGLEHTQSYLCTERDLPLGHVYSVSDGVSCPPASESELDEQKNVFMVSVDGW